MKRVEFLAALKAAGWMLRSEDFAREEQNDGLRGMWTVSVVKREDLPARTDHDRIRLAADISHVEDQGETLASARAGALARVQEWEELA